MTGRGWVIAECDVETVSVHLAGELLCHATYGLPTPDIAGRYPHYPHADHAGFAFSAQLDETLAAAADETLVVRVRTADGRETSRALRVHLAAAAGSGPGGIAAAAPEILPELWPIRISLESARLDHGGILRLAGWIVALLPIAEVRMFLDGQLLAEAELGLERPDVAANYPLYPNAGWSGFRLAQDVGELESGPSVVRIHVTCEGGVRRQIMMPVDRPPRQNQVLVQDSAIHFCADSFALRADGSVAVAGWAVSDPGITAIRVSLDGEPIGEAELGRSRPDVGNRFPRIPGARQAGFYFARTLEHPISGEHLLTLLVCNADGEERDVLLPLHAEELGSPASEPLDQPAIRFDIDTPTLAGGRAAEPVRGLLTIGGWAVARAGIATIEIALDDRAVGLAHTGIRREDIAALFPDISGALLAGFAFTLPHRLTGDHTIRLTVRTTAGEIAEQAFSLTGESAEAGTAGLAIRFRLTQAEADFGLLVLNRLGRRPRFHVFIRTDSAGGEAVARLSDTMESLVRQAYPDWRVTVLLPPSPGEASADETAAGRVLMRRLTDGNAAEPLAGAEDGDLLIMVLAAGDRLGADALLRFATEAASSPGTTLLYADERRYDPALALVQPYYKPDWSPDLLLSTNYIGRACCLTADVARAAGLTLADAHAGRDYDFVLRASEAAENIRHLSELLLDRAGRMCEDAADEAHALRRTIGRRRLGATLRPGAAPGTWRVQRQVGAAGLVSVIIPTCAARGLIERAVASLRAQTPADAIEIICIDSIPADQPHWKTWLRANADLVVETAAPFNWSLYNNIGATVARGAFLLFLNDDVEVLDPGWLEALLEHAQRPEIGVVGPLLLYPDGKVQHAGMFLAHNVGRHAFRFAPADEPGPFGLAQVQRDVIAVTGACMLMRREVFDALDGFDEAHGIVNNDLDFCFRLWARGLRVVFTPYSRLTHHELASRAALPDSYDVERFARTWSTRFSAGDPFFNRALSTASDDFSPQTEPIQILHIGRPLIARERVRTILAVKVDHIGDFIMALPALRRLKLRFPKARLCVLGAAASGRLASLEPAIDEFIPFNFFHVRSGIAGTVAGDAELRALAERLRPHGFDLAVDLRMQGETRHILRHANAAYLAGFDRDGRFPWLDVALEWEGDRGVTAKRAHAGDRLLQLVETLSVACEPDGALIAGAPLTEDRPGLESLLGITLAERPLICIHPGVGSDMKQWPASSYAALIDLLTDAYDVGILLIGVEEEAAIIAAITRQVARPAELLSLAGKIPLGDLPMVLRNCRLFVGNDSGPKHLAAALGVPTLGIHSSNVDPVEWGPAGPNALAIRRKVICGPCYIANPSDCHRDLFCLKSIRPGDVFGACQTLLLPLRLRGGSKKFHNLERSCWRYAASGQ